MPAIKIIVNETYELKADIAHVDDKVSLRLLDLWLTVNKPEWHERLNITLTPEEANRLGRFLVDATEEW